MGSALSGLCAASGGSDLQLSRPRIFLAGEVRRGEPAGRRRRRTGSARRRPISRRPCPLHDRRAHRYYPSEKRELQRGRTWRPGTATRFTMDGAPPTARSTTCAHSRRRTRLMPLPSYARVTNLANGYSVIVRVNDRKALPRRTGDGCFLPRRRRSRFQRHRHGAGESGICRPRCVGGLRRRQIAGRAYERMARPRRWSGISVLCADDVYGGRPCHGGDAGDGGAAPFAADLVASPFRALTPPPAVRERAGRRRGAQADAVRHCRRPRFRRRGLSISALFRTPPIRSLRTSRCPRG